MFDRWGLPIRTSEAELYRRAVLGQKPQPLNFTAGIDSVGFSINPLVFPIGKIVAIRVQDLARNLWFNYDNGVWDKTPECTPGAGNLYIAAYANNTGGSGTMTMLIRDEFMAILGSKQETVVAGGTIGVESGARNMLSRAYGITIDVMP